MTSYGLVAAVLLPCVLTFSAAQTTCKSRCGAEYYRGYMCQCDFSCLLYGECCKDYESQCTTKNSCKGRCGESFKRGRLCSCDPDCVKYKQCCPDYKLHCDELEVNEEENVATPVKPDCENVHKPAEPSTEAIEQPIEAPGNEGSDPGDHFNPTVNPISYPQDDPNSASKIFQNDELEGPGSSPTPESSSGFGPTPPEVLEDFTGPPLPDIDGFEILPETITVQPETQTTPSKDEQTTNDTSSTTADPSTTELTQTTSSEDEETTTLTSFTTVVSSSAEPTSQTMVADVQSTPPQPTTTNLVPTQPTSEPTSNSTDPQTEPTRKEDNITETITTFTTELPERTTGNSQMTDSPTTTEKSTLPQDPYASTTVPTKANEETLNQEINATSLPNLSTLSSVEVVTEVTTMATTNAELDTTIVTTTAEGMTTQSPISSVQPSLKPVEKPKPEKPFKPVLSPEHKPVLNGINGVDNPRDFQADDSNDTDLCSGRPVSGVTTLSNGTMVVFRGHFFWVLDRNRVPGPAQGITAVWGVPSPIDTIFTRCNCQGKTYIFKGPQYWRFENDALDPGFPKVIETGFDGLRGHITAALSVPQHNRRREAVYFFKRGGTVQRYSYQFGTKPTCGRKAHYALYTVRNRLARQVPAHVSLLEPAINIRTSWRGFPTTVTAAVSIPTRAQPEGYKYYVYSRSKSYRVRMDAERPVLADSSPNAPPQNNEVFKCPKKVPQTQ